MKAFTILYVKQILKIVIFLFNVVILLNLCACCSEGSHQIEIGSEESVSNDVQTKMDENVDDGMTIAIDSFTEKTIGNQDEKDALSAKNAFLRADWEQEADWAMSNKLWLEAVRKYNKALNFVDHSDENQNPAFRQICAKIIECYQALWEESDREGDKVMTQYYWLKQSDTALLLAKYETDPDQKAEDYLWSGQLMSFINRSKSCDSYNKAMQSAETFELKQRIIKVQSESGCP